MKSTEKIAAFPKEQTLQCLGRSGGLKGGVARAAALSVERRKEIARKAATARWEKNHDRGSLKVVGAGVRDTPAPTAT